MLLGFFYKNFIYMNTYLNSSAFRKAIFAIILPVMGIISFSSCMSNQQNDRMEHDKNPTEPKSTTTFLCGIFKNMRMLQNIPIANIFHPKIGIREDLFSSNLTMISDFYDYFENIVSNTSCNIDSSINIFVKYIDKDNSGKSIYFRILETISMLKKCRVPKLSNEEFSQLHEFNTSFLNECIQLLKVFLIIIYLCSQECYLEKKY